MKSNVCVQVCLYTCRELRSMLNQKCVSLDYINAFSVYISVIVLKYLHFARQASSQKVQTNSPVLECVPDFLSFFQWMKCGSSDGMWLPKDVIKGITSSYFLSLWNTWCGRSQLPCHEIEFPYLANKNSENGYF